MVFATWDTADVDRGFFGTTIRRCDIETDGNIADARHRGDLKADLLDICGTCFAWLNLAPLLRVAEGQHDADLHDVIGVIAKRKLRKQKKAVDGSADGRHKQKSELDLCGDESAPAMPGRH